MNRRPHRRTTSPPAEPAVEPVPTIRRESPTIVSCTDGLRGVVSRWHCSATQIGEMVSLVRLSGGAAPQHPRTVERHRAAVGEWLRRGGVPS